MMIWAVVGLHDLMPTTSTINAFPKLGVTSPIARPISENTSTLRAKRELICFNFVIDSFRERIYFEGFQLVF
jgi:hypothetical protein